MRQSEGRRACGLAAIIVTCYLASMDRPSGPLSALDRVRRSRRAMRAKGLRPVTLWIPDTRSPAFLAEAARQCRLANEADKSDPAVAFADSLADEWLRELDESGL